MRLDYSNYGSNNLGATYNPYGSYNPYSSYGFGGAPNNAFGVGSSIGGGLGTALGSLFGGGSTMDAAMPYASQIPNMLQQYLSPYIQQGQNVNLNPYMQMGLNLQPQLQNMYSNLANNPTQMMNQIGSSYQESPGYKFAVQQGTQQATDAANRAAAAGGLVGSPGEQQSLAKYISQMTTGYAGQDYQNYMQNALGQLRLGMGGLTGLEQQGLGVGEGLEQQGYGASGMFSQGLAQYLQGMAQMAAQQQQQQNQQASGLGGIFGSILGGAASFIPGVGGILGKIL